MDRKRSFISPLLDANPEVIKMALTLFLLLVPPLLLQHFPLCFLQQLQAVHRQKHVGEHIVLWGAPLIVVFLRELV